MKRPANYDAFWLPGLDQDFDQDTAIRYGYRWLGETEERTKGQGVIVMWATEMADRLPHMPRTWEVLSRRSHRYPTSPGPVLAIWPDVKTLELAETLARGQALCVIPGRAHEMRPWIRRTEARCLVDGFEVEDLPALSDEVAAELDSSISWGAHNAFLGGSDKPYAIRGLRLIAHRPDRLTRQQVDEYVAWSGETDLDGAERLGQWYEEIQKGKRHRDGRGETIR